MPKSNLAPINASNDSASSSDDNFTKSNGNSKIPGISNRIRNIFSSFTHEDILLILLLLILMQEDVDDDFLVVGIILLILTE